MKVMLHNKDDQEDIKIRWTSKIEESKTSSYRQKPYEAFNPNRSWTWPTKKELGLTSPRWSVSAATKEDTLQGSAGHPGIKTAGTGSLPEGPCQLRKLLQMPKCLSVMALAMIGVTKQKKIIDKCKIGLGYNAIPPPYTGNFMPPKPDLVYPSLDDFVDEFVSESVVKKLIVETNEPKTARKEQCAQFRLCVLKVNTVKGTMVNIARPKAVLSAVKGNKGNAVKASACWVWRPKHKILDHGNPQQDLKDKGVINSGCSRHMIGNRSYLTDYKEIDGVFVAFGDFKLTDESHVLLKVPRKDNMYSVDLKNVVPQGGLTCLFAKATPNESNLWHRRLGHVNFKTMNKLVRGNLVRGLPSKVFEINQTCVACQKGKQHRASGKTKTVSSISQPLQMLHMDLFGPTFVKSLMKKMYCLVVTDDFSRFSWVFFLATKDETSEILKTFITGIENLIDLRVKVIRCDNGTEFKNRVMNQFYEMKGIKREFSVARTLQQNGVAETKNRTLIEAVRTMLADSKLPTTFWAEAVNTACYVQNRVLVIKPHNKTPYELFLDHLCKFDGKADEGFVVGYSTNSKAFRVFNSRNRIVKENLHVQFSENTPNIAGSGSNWLFDIHALTKSMNYKTIVIGNQSNGNAGTKACNDVGKARMEIILGKDYILLPMWPADPLFSQNSKSSPDVGFKPSGDDEVTKEPGKEGGDSSKEDESDDR
ncbi:putative ribonuclease H-like domain-containing protein [Tanacetum coccineum]